MVCLKLPLLDCPGQLWTSQSSLRLAAQFDQTHLSKITNDLVEADHALRVLTLEFTSHRLAKLSFLA